jgi:hypothetical protein
VVPGVADRALLDDDLADATVPPRAIDRRCGDRLDEADRAFPRDCEPGLELETPDGLTLACTHGAAGSRTPTFAPETPANDLEALLDATDATLVVGGTTHEPTLRRRGARLLVNPGSVGRPYGHRGTGSVLPEWAEYAVVENDADALGASLRRVPVDPEAVAASARAAGMPEADWWLGVDA